MILDKLKSQILSDLPKLGILRPSMEKFDECFDFWIKNFAQKEKFSFSEMDALDIILYSHAVGFHFGNSADNS